MGAVQRYHLVGKRRTLLVQHLVAYLSRGRVIPDSPPREEEDIVGARREGG